MQQQPISQQLNGLEMWNLFVSCATFKKQGMLFIYGWEVETL